MLIQITNHLAYKTRDDLNISKSFELELIYLDIY